MLTQGPDAVSSPNNGSCYRATIHALACRRFGIRHPRTRLYRPQTNGKAELFIRTLLNGWAYGAVYSSSTNAPEPLTAGSGTTTIDADNSALGHQAPVNRTDEDEETFRAFADRMRAYWSPQGEMESVLVEQIINQLWRLRRISQVEAGLFAWEAATQSREQHLGVAHSLELTEGEFLLRRLAGPSRILNEKQHERALAEAASAEEVLQTPLAQLGAAFARAVQDGDAFTKLSRYETALTRGVGRAVELLRQLQSERQVRPSAT